MAETLQVKLYAFRLKIGEHVYGGQIPATSWNDAKAKALKFGAVIDGELQCEMPDSGICSICGGDVVKDLTNPKPIAEDEWTDTIDI